MKTNQNLIRKMGEFDVTQRTKDGFFNATYLLKQWNSQSKSERKMDNYFNVKGTNEFINTIMERENLHTPKSVYVKTRASRGLNAGTWMHPLLFIDFAMWINPNFKYDVLKFVYDELIKFRNDAGTAYIEMCEQIARISNKKETADNIKKVAQAINFIAQNKHQKMIRKEADEDQLREYLRMQKGATMLTD